MVELIVDFNDSESVARAIPRAKGLIQRAEHRVAEGREEVSRAQERVSEAEIEIQRLRTVLLTLEQLAVEPVPAPPASADHGSSKEQALRVVIAINGSTNVAEVAEHMTGFSRKTVSWALWKLADEGVIMRLGPGRYAPLDYLPGRPTTNYLKLPPGFPLPSPSQIEHAAAEATARAKAR